MSDDADREGRDHPEGRESRHDGNEQGARGPRPVDDDAWASACAEDLAAERERRRRDHGGTPPPGDAAEELRKLAAALTDQLGRFGLGGLAGAGLAAQARAAVEPVLERNAEAIQHLANAGQELLAAYRSAVLSQEQRWTRSAEHPEPPEPPAPDQSTESADASEPPTPAASTEPDDPAPGGPSQRIDLD
ncbi:DUF5304 family protein [Streptomyces hainanensis]|uniref:DUF5304 domain-containing protein n=1 Tax=Streptomyces hainanensis TaxID=402648 RepID=A0A4R4TAK6_9ACTN|nr:DUF5304 family protein [Streptomyces hainanensis]TDC71309.1 hypothetical protein E1283_23655 [Streptomyces hainanensis]